MFRALHTNLWRAAAVALAMTLAHSAAWAAPSPESASKWQEFLQKGDLKSAEIELRNAIKAAPKDPALHARLAAIYLRLGDPVGAEREARTARDLHGDEASYLAPLAVSLLRQGKYSDLLNMIEPGNRVPELESQARMFIGAAEFHLHEFDKAEPPLRDAIRLNPRDLTAKLELAQLLIAKDKSSAEAGRLVDAVLTAQPKAVMALELKARLTWAGGDTDGAMRLFDEALKLAPNYWPVKLERAALNLALNKFETADSDLDPVLKLAPRNFQANYLRALERAKQGKFAESERILTQLEPYFGDLAEAYYLLGGVEFMLGRNAQAEEALAKYLARVPGNQPASRLIALAALRQGAPSRAISYLEPAVGKSPNAELLSMLGQAYMADHKPELALQQFERAAALEPLNPQIETNLAISKIDTGRPNAGTTDLEKIFESKSGATIAGPTLAFIDLRTGRPDKAAQVASSLVKKETRNPLYQTILGVALAGERKYAEAETALRAAMKLQPGFGPAVHNLAQIYLAMGRMGEVRELYQDQLAKKPNDVSALIGLADVDVVDKKWQQAIDELNRARSAASQDATPGLKLVSLYLLRKNTIAAKALASELASQFPTNLAVATAQGRAQLAAGDQGGAISSFRHAHELAPNSGPILAVYVKLLLASKDPVTARSVLQSAFDRNPKNPDVKASLIAIDADVNGLDAALTKAREFSNADPDNDLYKMTAAELAEKAGRVPDAVKLLEEAAAAHPFNDKVAINLSHAYDLAGQANKAESTLTDYLKQKPQDVPVRVAMAELYILHKKYSAAIAEHARLLAVLPTDPVVLNNLAFLYQQTGDLAKAREFAERAVATAPSNGQLQDTLGWVLLAQGDTDKALAHLRTAVTTDPGDAEIKYHLAVALGRAGNAAEARAVLEKLLGSNASFGSRANAEKLLTTLKQG